MEKGKIVIVEGTSCVGKTTLCKNLKEKGWEVVPEAIRYLEKEKGKKGDEASPIPNLQAEEERYQDELFRVEKEKLEYANKLRNIGKNVVIDKSAIATVATAKAFEKQMGFNGTFKRAYDKYCQFVQDLEKEKLVECDIFLLLTADYKTICKRNKTRNHVLNGVWLEEETIKEQRKVLEIMEDKLVGKIGKNPVEKYVLDTTYLTKENVVNYLEALVSKEQER